MRGQPLTRDSSPKHSRAFGAGILTIYLVLSAELVEKVNAKRIDLAPLLLTEKILFFWVRC